VQLGAGPRERAELVLVGEGRQARASDGELRAALYVLVEPDYRPAAGAMARSDDRRGLAGRVERRALREDALSFARAVDEEAAVEPVRLPDPPDRHEVRAHAR